MCKKLALHEGRKYFHEILRSSLHRVSFMKNFQKRWPHGAINIDSYQVERATFVSNLGRKTLIPISATKQFRLVEIIGPIFALLKFLTASLRIWSLPLCLRRLTTPYFTANTWFSLIQKLRWNYWPANLALKIIWSSVHATAYLTPFNFGTF